MNTKKVRTDVRLVTSESICHDLWSRMDKKFSRQCILFGESMNKITDGKVYIVGGTPLGTEIAKHLAITGLGGITIRDSSSVTDNDHSANCLISGSRLEPQQHPLRVISVKDGLDKLGAKCKVDVCSDELRIDTDLSFLNGYQCVLFADPFIERTVQFRVDDYCRSRQPPIPFISTGTVGYGGFIFSDFGQRYTAVDLNGEEPVELFITNISKEGLVTCMESSSTAGLQNEFEFVEFSEVIGMEFLTGRQFKVKIVGINSLQVCNLTEEFQRNFYKGGGRIKQVKQRYFLKFDSMEKQNYPDFYHNSKENGGIILSTFSSLHLYRERQGCFPKLASQVDVNNFLLFTDNATSMLDEANEYLKRVSNALKASSEIYLPLVSSLAGAAAIEVLKAVSGKFTPVQQWFFMDAFHQLDCDVGHSAVGSNGSAEGAASSIPKLYFDAKSQLHNSKVLVIGCGAIGVEVLKNMALMSICEGGSITVVDDDLIQSSNSTTSYMFSPITYKREKVQVAVEVCRTLNPRLQLHAISGKACPDSAKLNMGQEFFSQFDAVVSCVDNFDSRRYIDSCIVDSGTIMVDGGVDGLKGHVLSVIPNITENYSSQGDPVGFDVPYCVLKSFPSIFDHCVVWSREKFVNLFVNKPKGFNEFWENYESPMGVMQCIRAKHDFENAGMVVKMLENYLSTTWSSCLELARLKFEKYFNFKARNLLNHFPPDTTVLDGSMFWQSLKKIPEPLQFNVDNPCHLRFVIVAAHLFANASGVAKHTRNEKDEYVKEVLSSAQLPAFKPKSKVIETDENAEKPETESGDDEDVTKRLGNQMSLRYLDVTVYSDKKPAPLEVQELNSDCDLQFEFLALASVLRADMYDIEPRPWYQIMKICFDIVPVISPTAATVAGLMVMELIEGLRWKGEKKCLLAKDRKGRYSNTFFNLATNTFVRAEPGVMTVEEISGLYFTIWDRWEIQGERDWTLQRFLNEVQHVYKVAPSMILRDSKIIYWQASPTHSSIRLNKQILELLKAEESDLSIRLSLLVEDENGEDQSVPTLWFRVMGGKA